MLAPADLTTAKPDTVLLFLGDMLPETRRAMPELEAKRCPLMIADETSTG